MEINEIEKQQKMDSDLDYIFSLDHSRPDMKYSESMICTLADCAGINFTFGSCVEGYIFFQYAFYTIRFASKFLLTKDKNGYLEHCKKFKEDKKSSQQ